MELFTPDFGLVFWMFIAFGILFLVLWKFAWPVILRSVDSRADLIDKGVEYAQDAKAQLDNARSEAESYLNEARRQQADILREADKMKTQISTLIPTVSIFVSIIGTFAVMSLIGFSINLLTLFALVLAIGTVVDDAIVVVEAVQAKFDEGYRSPVLAADDAMKGVSSAILTSTIIFMAVFIPVAMMGGTSGAFYAQFGITMAVAVGISAVNAFTLSPALCALFLRPYIDEHGNTKNNFAARFRKAFNAVFDRLSRRYVRGVLYIIHRRWLLWGTISASFGLLVLLVNITKTGLIPQEDTGTVMVSMNTKPGSSMAQTNRVMARINSRLDSIGEIEYSGAVGGFSFSGSGPSQAMYFMTLTDWDQRKGEGQSSPITYRSPQCFRQYSTT